MTRRRREPEGLASATPPAQPLPTPWRCRMSSDTVFSLGGHPPLRDLVEDAEVLARVKAGEEIAPTERGSVIARIVPAKVRPLDDLVSVGRVRSATIREPAPAGDRERGSIIRDVGHPGHLRQSVGRGGRHTPNTDRGIGREPTNIRPHISSSVGASRRDKPRGVRRLPP